MTCWLPSEHGRNFPIRACHAHMRNGLRWAIGRLA